jgi:hypothetical protein
MDDVGERADNAGERRVKARAVLYSRLGLETLQWTFRKQGGQMTSAPPHKSDCKVRRRSSVSLVCQSSLGSE